MKNKILLFAFLLVSVAVSYAQPLAASAGVDKTICAGTGTTLSASVSFGSAPYTFSWSPTTGLSNPNIMVPTASPTITTIYTLTVTDNVLATSSDAMTLTVIPQPTLSATNNTPICEGQTINITSANNATSPSYSWAGPSSFTDFSQNPNVTGFMPWAGTYTLTLTDIATGCTNTITTTAIINALPVITVNSAGICFGNNVVLNAAGGISYNWSPPTGLSSTFVASPTASPTTTTTYTVNGTSSVGCVGTATSTVTVFTNPIISGSGTNLCLGGSDTIMASGALSYVWSGPNSFNSTLQNPVITNATAADGGTYFVSGTDANGCSGSYTVSVNINSNTDIAGHVAYSSGNVTGGNIFLIAQGNSSALFDTVQTTTTNAAGNFSFTALAGNYYVRAESSLSPDLVNTYFGNEYLWDSASIVGHGCSVTDSANILMLETAALSGSANISGTIYEGAGFGQKLILGPVGVMTNVIPGVPVKVGKNPGGAIVASTLTDAGGVFTFTNLPIDNYRIYTDIPGYPMDSSYSVSISGSETVVNLDYYVDSNSVYIDLTTVAHNMVAETAIYSVYPNPTNGKINIRFEKSDVAETVRLFDMNGKMIYSGAMTGVNTMQIDLSSLKIPDGIYLLDMQNSGKKFKINYFAEN